MGLGLAEGSLSSGFCAEISRLRTSFLASGELIPPDTGLLEPKNSLLQADVKAKKKRFIGSSKGQGWSLLGAADMERGDTLARERTSSSE